MKPTATLAGGVEMPRCGLGTFKAGGAELRAAVRAALSCGIRHIDTAAIYKNGAEIAAALWDEARVPRDEVFITSKISPYQMGRSKALAAADEILSTLRVEYVDCLLIHWPASSGVKADSPKNAELRLETWRALEELRASGRARAVGVSNFEAAHLKQLVMGGGAGGGGGGGGGAPIAVNQIECHPRYPSDALRAACADAGAAVVAYSPLGCGRLLAEPAVARVAAEVGRPASQVLLRWALQKPGVAAVIPKSVRPERIAEFAPAEVLSDEWGLNEAQMAALDALGAEEPTKYCWDPRGIL